MPCKIIFFVLALLSTQVLAQEEVGEVLKVVGNEVWLERDGTKVPLKAQDALFLSDKLSTGKGIVQILINPTTQVNLGQNSQFEVSSQSIEDNESSAVKSIVRLVQGQLRVMVEKLGTPVEQTVEAKGAAFAVRGTEFEIDLLDEEVDLQVFEGEVEVIDEGTSLGKVARDESISLPARKNGKRAFKRKAFAKRARLMEFQGSSEIKEKWRKRLERRRQRRADKSVNKSHERKARREERGDQRREERRARRR